MSTKKLLVLTGVLLGLLAFVLLFERNQPTSDEKEKARRNLVGFKVDEVTAVLVERNDLPKVEITRPKTGAAARRWRLSSAGVPPGPADAATVDALVADLARLEMVGEPRTSFDPKEFTLDKPKATATLTLEDGGKKTIAFGREIPGTDATAASESGRFAAVKFAPMATLSKPVDEFRSKQLLEVPSSDVSRIVVEKGATRVVAVRDVAAAPEKGADKVPEKAEWRLEAPVVDLANQTFVEQLLSDLTAARISEFVALPATDLPKVGLQPPTATISLQRGSEVVSTVSFGAAKAETTGKIYGRRDDLTFLVDDRVQDSLAKELSAFREAKVFPVDTWTLIRVSFDEGGQKTGAERVEGEWRSSGRSLPSSLAEDLVEKVTRAEVKRFVPRKDYSAFGIPDLAVPPRRGKKPSAPLATLEFRREKDASPLTLTFLPATLPPVPAGAAPAAQVVAVEATSRGDAMLIDRAVFDEARGLAAQLRAGVTPTPVKAASPAVPKAPAASATPK